MKVFISNVDSPVGYALSRLFSNTIVGARREESNEEGDQGEGEAEKPKEPYHVLGTLTSIPQKPKTSESSATENSTDQPAPQPEDAAAAALLDTIEPESLKALDEEIRAELGPYINEKMAAIGIAPKWVKDIIPVTEEKRELQEALFNSDIIIYDLVKNVDEGHWAIENLYENQEKFSEKPKLFIGISTVMTWAKTPVDPDDPEAYITEDEYRRRKPHPNFKKQFQAEKYIIKYGKKNLLNGYVIASGLVYHPGDSLFHDYLKDAWKGKAEMLCYGNGLNILPTIHLEDLCNIILEVAENPPEPKYLLAVDDSKNNSFEIVKAISDYLGSGKVKKIPKEQALLSYNISQQDYDMLQINLRLEPGHIKEISFEWKAESGIIENLAQLVLEYKELRNLTPIKVLLHGPPVSGKTHFAKKLAEYYQIHYLSSEEIVQKAVARIERRATGNYFPEEMEEEDEKEMAADKELWEDLKDAFRLNNNQYPEEQIITFVKEELNSMRCRNQGYVLDGYPCYFEQASELFKASSEEEDKKEDRFAVPFDEAIVPEFVISLETTDEFLKSRIMNMPESQVAGTKNSEEVLTKRIEEFRAKNTEENTMLNYFDENEIHPLVLNVEGAKEEALFSAMKKHIGKPHNYGPTPEQVAEKRQKVILEKTTKKKLEEEERVRKEKEEEERHKKAVSEWNLRLEEVRRQEQEVLESQSVPLRNYLVKHVMPVLTTGLIEVCKVRPEDPIDYLGEYLFKNNPFNANVPQES